MWDQTGIIPSTVSPTYLTYIRNCYNINIIYYAGKTTHRCGTGQESSPLLFPPSRSLNDCGTTWTMNMVVLPVQRRANMCGLHRI